MEKEEERMFFILDGLKDFTIEPHEDFFTKLTYTQFDKASQSCLIRDNHQRSIEDTRRRQLPWEKYSASRARRGTTWLYLLITPTTLKQTQEQVTRTPSPGNWQKELSKLDFRLVLRLNIKVYMLGKTL